MSTEDRDRPQPRPCPSSRRAGSGRRRAVCTTVAIGTVLALGSLASPVRATLRVPTPGFDAPTAAVVFTYHCSSSVTESDETYTISGTVPAEVVQGTEFTLADVVVTGTPTVDLLLVSLTVDLVAPIGATSVDGLSRTFLGPGSSVPPGPVAPAGTANSSPPMSFRFVASGAVGTTVDFFSGTMASVVADISDPSYTVAVTCARTSGSSFAATTIVAEPPETTTTTTTAPTTTTTSGAPESDGADVLGAGLTAAPPASTSVVARPAFTG